MSLLNVVIGGDVGWLCVDTMSRDFEDGRYFEQSKMVLLAHQNAVVACRGEQVFLAHVFLNCFMSRTESFDEITAIWPDLLADARTGYLRQAEAMGMAVPGMGHEIVLLGWSGRRDRPLCLVARRESDSEAFDVQEVTCRLAPGTSGKFTDFSSLSTMVALAREQVLAVRRDYPGEPIGGRLLLAEVTREGTVIRELARLD